MDNLLNSLTDIRISDSLNPSDFRSYLSASQTVYFSEIEDYLRYGSDGDDTDDLPPVVPNYQERKQYFELSVRRESLESLINSCTSHFRKLSRDVLSEFSNTTLRNVSYSTPSQFDERRFGFVVTTSNLNHPDSSGKLNEAQGNYNLSVRHYDIIPLPLILRFFEEWSDSCTMIPNFHECAVTAAGHLRF